MSTDEHKFFLWILFSAAIVFSSQLIAGIVFPIPCGVDLYSEIPEDTRIQMLNNGFIFCICCTLEYFGAKRVIEWLG
ncbi:MAG: hypothetical protein PHC39_04540 [Proteiniphilum sp.]|nr:hypothetical protein [Proteiniphilum sp.]